MKFFNTFMHRQVGDVVRHGVVVHVQKCFGTGGVVFNRVTVRTWAQMDNVQ